MIQTVWKCEQVRAGQVYERLTFDTQEQAIRFAREMQRVQPDMLFNIEPMDASLVWN
jgi:hypothetical protein